ncbi:hypothetical protein TruAng_001805 [Truncatella angustata]|nr:hypothetical protein TruAng_001805 [Truncatella angustata]
MHSLRSELRQMPVIEETIDDNNSSSSDGDMPPALPEKSPRRQSDVHRSLAVTLKGQAQPRYPPPAYSLNTPPGSVGKAGIPSPSTKRKPAWLIRRGGWWRLALVALAILLCILALSLGLALGLRSRNFVSGSSSAASESDKTYPLQFPAGSYAFTTALASISTSCTSNPSTFRCFPFTTYNASSSGAAATYFWSIVQTASAPAAYVISAQSNPFVPQFRNLSLAILDRDTDGERLTFSFPMDLAITPSTALDSSNDAATCWFNDTVMAATIWTRKRAEFPVNITTSVSATSPSTDFEAWPFAMQVEQAAGAGSGVPNCVDSKECQYEEHVRTWVRRMAGITNDPEAGS